jgi:predicted nucleic acid-binding protein
MPDGRGDFYFDTVALSNFSLVDRFDLLIARYGQRMRITSEVLDEVLEGVVTGHVSLAAVETALASARISSAESLSTSERDSYRELLRILSPGESSCIVCAKFRQGIVVSDDRTARECCKEHEVAFTGTIGILKAMCLDEMLSAHEADEILHAMIHSGYYSPVQRISDIL